jgi:hypothetical protein
LRRTENQNSYAIKELPGFTPDNLIGHTFLTDTCDDRERFRARITRKILDPDKPSDVKFLAEINDGEYDEILAYNEILVSILLLCSPEDQSSGEATFQTYGNKQRNHY